MSEPQAREGARAGGSAPARNTQGPRDACRAAPDTAIDGTDYTEAELRYLIRSEFARTLADLLQRRTSLAITGMLSSAAISQATSILADELGWAPDEAAQQEASFRGRLVHDHGLTPSILTARDRNTGSLECA